MYIVNGKKVEYLYIHQDPSGDTIVNYDEKFNLVKAHVGVIMTKLHENGLKGVHIFKDLKYKIISIQLKDISQLHGVLHALDIPYQTYEVLNDENIIVIDTPCYERAIGIENPITLIKKSWLPYI